jgi:hypothetical protein
VDPLNINVPRRREVLDNFYACLMRQIDPALDASFSVDHHEIPAIVPHPRLRLVLESDPVMGAILPSSSCRFSLGPTSVPPFRLRPEQLIQLSPALLDDPPAIACAARWGMEAAKSLRRVPADRRPLRELLRYGAEMLLLLPAASRELFLSLLPTELARELVQVREPGPAKDLLAWQASLLDDVYDDVYVEPSDDSAQEPCELATPLEDILVSGGDTRLNVNMASGLNKYGVPPRPRPEAIHFSSSTASAVSDYGFLYGEMLRQELLSLVRSGCRPRDLLSQLVNAISGEICRMLNVDVGEADVAIAPSGTDTELLAVMLAIAGAEGRPVTNILIAPEESGSGVALAGAGRYFDDKNGTGLPVEKGSVAWPNAPVALEIIRIRDADFEPRKSRAIDREFLEHGRRALAKDGHVLGHVLWASKTGLVAPSQAAVEQLVSLAPKRVDIVIDACQMRMNLPTLGAYLRSGCLLQVTGSKFLTGPPFSGALVLPPTMRARLAAVCAAMEAAPAVTHADSWTEWWSARLPTTNGTTSFGPLFRWLPALLEAALFRNLPSEFCNFAFEEFRRAVTARVVESAYLRPISSGELSREEELFARLSIVSFEVMGRQPNGELAPLCEAECRYLFEQLNRDTNPLLPGLAGKDRALARQEAHIGQPVTLQSQGGAITVMRMVIGARFFSIVGFAEPGAITASLESEIADAQRAISKIELLAENWPLIATNIGVR